MDSNGEAVLSEDFASDKASLVDSLEITPRVLVLHRKPKVNTRCERIIRIKNNGLHARLLHYATDSRDVTLKTLPEKLFNNFLDYETAVQLIVTIKPRRPKYSRYYVYIHAIHPNITFEIPIIVLKRESNISTPEKIIFPATCPVNETFYELILYNKSFAKLKYLVQRFEFPLISLSLSTKVKVMSTSASKIPKNGYLKVLLKQKVRCYEREEGFFKIKIEDEPTVKIDHVHEPIRFSIYCDRLNLTCSALKFTREEKKTIHVCNESNILIDFNVRFLSAEEEIVDSTTKMHSDDEGDIIPGNVDPHADRHFTILTTNTNIPGNSAVKFTIIFRPIVHEDFEVPDELVPPYKVSTNLVIELSDEYFKKSEILNVNGLIVGPTIDIIPKTFHLPTVYFGEEHCAQIKVINTDGYNDLDVSYYGCRPSDIANVTITPAEGFHLTPCQRGLFHIQFFATSIGKFIVKFEFKVKYGGLFAAFIKGTSRKVHCRAFPEMLSLGLLPVAVPQKRLIMIVNPISVPITVQFFIKDDGTEVPLVLNIQDVNEHLPIDVLDPIEHMRVCVEEERKPMPEINDIVIRYDTGTPTSGRTVHSVQDDSSSISVAFEDTLLEQIPQAAPDFVKKMRGGKILQKPDAEKFILDEVLNVLLGMPYFQGMDKNKNYVHMDWNALANDPREIYVSEEIIYLAPNTGKAMSVVIIPNVVGFRQRFISMRVCPEPLPALDDEPEDSHRYVDSSYMEARIPIEYTCAVPEITWDNIINMEERLYVGEFYDFAMAFENNDDIGGFFYYDVVPDSRQGTMTFLNSKWKYFIEPQSMITVPCTVKFGTVGAVSLSGIIKFVGVQVGYPFHVNAMVLPSNVKTEPTQITKNMRVLKEELVYVFIHNDTPTCTWLGAEMKVNECIEVDPSGAQLSPKGQSTYLTLRIYFRDPGIYHNCLLIRLEFKKIVRIPITLNVSGMPIRFEPDICGGELNFGIIICSTEDEYIDMKPNFSKTIKIINYGERQYRLVIKMLKASEAKGCAVKKSVRANIHIDPLVTTIEALSVKELTIWTRACDETILGPFKFKHRFEGTHKNELMLSMGAKETKEFFVILDKEMLKDHKGALYEGRILSVKSVYLRVKIFSPELNLVHDDIILFSQNHEAITYVPILNVKPLKAIYKWKKLHEEWHYIREEDDAEQTAELVLSDILHMLNILPQDLENDSEKNLTLRYQKYRCLLKKIEYDPMNIKGIVYELIENLDLSHKRYKLDWVEPEPPFVERECQDDDMPEHYTTPEEMQTPMIDSEYENSQNLHAHKGKLSLEPSIQLTTLIENTIDTALERDPSSMEENLKFIEENLEGQVLFFNKRFEIEPPMDASGDTSKQTCVYQAVDHILDHLKLEDSYTTSQPSTETCELTRSIYFLEKFGMLAENQKEMCALHLPPVKKGFEVRANFQLDVVGGESKSFQITLVNLEKTLQLSKESIYLGLKPWYDTYKATFTAENVTNYEIVLSIEKSQKPDDGLPKIAAGYAQLITNRDIRIPAFASSPIKVEGVLGFSEEFVRDLKIVINNGEEILLTVKGHGVLPMLTTIKRDIEFVEQHQLEIIEEYELLRKIYYFEIFKAITIQDEDLDKDAEEEGRIVHASSSQAVESESEWMTEEEEAMYFILQEYVLVNNNEELPNDTVLDQLLETEKFLNRLRYSKETCVMLNNVYQNDLIFRNTYKDKLPPNLKSFTTQPLPFELRARILDLGDLHLNQYRKVKLGLEFCGPGKLIASARTALKIPGLVVDFELEENTGDKGFVYHRCENKPICLDKPYRNIGERLLDAKTNPRVKHAHSFDVSRKYRHERNVKTLEIQCIKNYYNSLNKSLYMEQKHHFTHCKIFTICKYNFSGTKINVVVLFKPEAIYFQPEQIFEDFLYIDVHMGPTLPILMRGLFKNYCKSGAELSSD
uniref:Uncharacterized protein n=1 Tax=Glossina austeni TaxID=7395 RepID=A0A1A9VXN7_GLOAU